MTPTLHLIRHGPTHARSMIGWTDLPADLSDHAQIARLSALLPQDAPIVSSDLLRARQTAGALQGDRQRLTDLPALREIHFGAWEARSFDEVNADTPDPLRAFWETPGDTAPPGGESWHQLMGRVDPAIDALWAQHPQLIVVAHFGAILTQVQRALGLTIPQAFSHKIEPLSLTTLTRRDGRWDAPRINHVA